MYENKINTCQGYINSIINTKSPSKKIPKIKKFLEFIEIEEKILKEQFPNGIYPKDNDINNINKDINKDINTNQNQS